MKALIGCLLLALVGFLMPAACAAPLAIGDSLPPITAQDQHGLAFNSTNAFQFLLVATEMDCAKAANKALAEQGAGFLEQHHAAYLLDIHTMPGIARFFAFPKMRKYPQRIILVDSAEALAAFPRQPCRVTVVRLTPAHRVASISYWDPETEPVAGCFP